MPRRPPQYPLHRGLVWRQFTFGEGQFGDSLGEWAYVSPAHPEGLRETDLGRAPLEEQKEVAQFWFLSNYMPHNGEGLGRGSQPRGAPMPQFWAPVTILTDEFANVIPQNTLDALIRLADAQADFWWFVPALQKPRPPEASASPQLEAEQALASLSEAVEAFASLPAGLGHNQGPQILDAETRAAIKEAVQEGLVGLTQGPSGTAPSRPPGVSWLPLHRSSAWASQTP